MKALRVQRAEDFGRVAVLMGGWAAEREVSLASGAQVLAALQRRGVRAEGVDATPAKILALRSDGFDRIFNVLHGTGGEDGVVSAAMSLLGLPCTGSGVMASALSMDKLRTKRLWRGADLPTPAYRIPRSAQEAKRAVEELGLPLFVKPNNQGSSVGMSKVAEAGHMDEAYALARRYSHEVLVEQFVAGPEYTASVLAGEALPLIRIQPAGEYYDYHAKYVAEDTQYHCPCGLPAELEERLQALCLRAFDAIGARGWGRVDFMLDQGQQPWLIEANTVPGMTSHSLVPMAARAWGIEFEELCWRVLETSLPEEVE